MTLQSSLLAVIHVNWQSKNLLWEKVQICVFLDDALVLFNQLTPTDEAPARHGLDAEGLGEDSISRAFDLNYETKLSSVLVQMTSATGAQRTHEALLAGRSRV